VSQLAVQGAGGLVLIEEARWLARCFERTPDAALFPLVNVGSSTAAFRTVEQPFIQSVIFDPLARRGGLVMHVDAKATTGVDSVGDMTDPKFIRQLKDSVAVRAALVSNLLEHVTDRELIAQNVLELVPAGGLIFVSGPHSYPLHPDPIDTGFRPSPSEVHALFPGTAILGSAMITSTRWRPWTGVSPARYLARLCVPFYRPTAWWQILVRTAYVLRPVSAYAIVLAKADPTAEGAFSARGGRAHAGWPVQRDPGL
jgi:hypothetical protein